MKKILTFFLTMLVTCSVAWGLTGIQTAQLQDTPRLFEQERDGAPVRPLSPDRLAELRDPFFNLVLRDHAEVFNLARIEALITANSGEEQTFVVSELIESESPGSPNRPATRRAVLTFSGENQGETLDRNIMMSVFFNANRFPDIQNIEALGWDSQQERYNYYKLDQQGTGNFSWKFRGSSVGADQLSPRQRAGTCLQCHINGAPVFKELPFPWNNWHSFQDQASYLRTRWPVGQNPRIRTNLRGAEELETKVIVPAIHQFNTTQIEANIDQTSNQGINQALDGQRLLRPLFTTTEFNLISSGEQVGGLHPFSELAPGPFNDVRVPNSFFLNADLIGGNGPAAIQGLQIPEANRFSDAVLVEPDEYRQLIANAQVKLGGQEGDANFAWFTPQASQIDNDWVDQLLTKGIVTPEFVAAVLAIDLETPFLSTAREELLRFIPEQFTFTPLDQQSHPDNLTQQVIAALETENPADGSTAAEFLTLLRSDNPVDILQARVADYRNRLVSLLADPTTRFSELTRLYDLAIAHRQAIRDSRSLRPLDEFGLLFPLP